MLVLKQKEGGYPHPPQVPTNIDEHSEGGCSTIAERTRSRRASFSPESAAHALGQHDFVDNLEVLLLSFFYLKIVTDIFFPA